MLRNGGLILWHDYRYRNLETIGVRRYLDELSETLPLVRLHETSFVAYRSAIDETEISTCDSSVESRLRQKNSWL